ncbi:MAG: tetratricopeptide repeat protein [Alphaproteobacteria bacterium]|nr:tetratricopeptide repeat protein [Alphaproteobacteria bacterium]
MRAPDIQIKLELQKAFEEFNRGQPAAAQARAEVILKRLPREPNALYLMGIINHQAGRLDQASKFFEKSYKSDPNNPAALSGIGIVRLDQQRYAEAVRAFQALLKHMPNDASVLNNLGIAQKSLQRFDLAIPLFQKAIQINPRFADAYVNYGSLLNSLGEAQPAREVLEAGLRHNPADRSLALNLSDALVGLGLFDDAKKLMEPIFAADPSDIEIRSRFGFLLVSMGEVEAARRVFEDTIKQHPGDAAAYFDLADLLEGKRGADKTEAGQMREKGIAVFTAAHKSVSDGTPVLVHRVAQAYEGLGEVEKSFQCFKIAQDQFKARLASIGKVYDRRATESLYDNLIARFTDQTPGAAALSGPSGSPEPIFIVGMPRSGTSLIEQILAAHPSIYGGGELMLLPDLINARLKPGEDLAEMLGRLSEAELVEMRDVYRSGLSDCSAGEAFVTDKLPFNFINVGLIRMLFPKALIINIERYPLDVCWSVFTQRFSSEMLFDHDLRDIGHYYRQYDRLMQFWRDWDTSIVPIQYEVLLDDMATLVLPMLDKLNLDWDPAMERFFENKRTVQTASRLQVRRPLYKTSIGRWKAFESKMDGLKSELGDVLKRYL